MLLAIKNYKRIFAAMHKRLLNYITNKRHLAAGLCYLSLSILFAFWITRLPEVKHRLDLSEGDLGIALFFIPVGSIISMMLTTSLIRKIGEGKTAVYAILAFSSLAILPFLAVSYTQLCLSLFVLGFTMGWVDISINAVVNTIEKIEKVNIMSTSHGFFSLGGILGGIIGGLIAGSSISGGVQMVFSCLFVIIIVLLFVRKHIGNLHDEDNKAEAPLFALPTKPVFVLALISFCIMTSEGAVTDWSTVYLNDFLGSSPEMAGFGFAAFSLTMTLGRFGGDHLIYSYGNRGVVFTGSIVALIGIFLVMMQSIGWSILGFALIGTGYSCVVPVIFSGAAKVKGINPAYGLASVASAGFFGFLIGPVLMGLIAEEYGLNNSFLMVLILTIITMVGSWKLNGK